MESKSGSAVSVLTDITVLSNHPMTSEIVSCKIKKSKDKHICTFCLAVYCGLELNGRVIQFITIWETNLKVLLRGFVGQSICVQHQLRGEQRLDTGSFWLKTQHTKLNWILVCVQYSNYSGVTDENTETMSYLPIYLFISRFSNSFRVPAPALNGSMAGR